MEKLALWALTTLITSIVGSFIGAYSKEKGKNLATKKDFDNLLAQVSATTEATKAIEAQISDKFWHRQKLWEMRQEALVAAHQALRDVDEALTRLDHAFDPQRLDIYHPSLIDAEKIKVAAEWINAKTVFGRKKMHALLVCGKEVNDSLNDAWNITNKCGAEIMDGQPKAYLLRSDQMRDVFARVFYTMRRELNPDK